VNDWNGCKCSAWDTDGHCTVCGEHYTEQFGVIAERIDRLETDKRVLNDRIEFWQDSAFHGGRL